jgi:hypothetical protein
MSEMNQNVRHRQIGSAQVTSSVAGISEDDANASSEAFNLIGCRHRLRFQSFGELKGDPMGFLGPNEVRHLNKRKIEHKKQKR